MIYSRTYLIITLPMLLLMLLWYNLHNGFNFRQELILANDFVSDFEKSLNFCRSDHRAVFYSDKMPNMYEWTDIRKIPSYSEPDYNNGFTLTEHRFKADPVGFNIMINSLIPLNRRLPNRRPEQCRYWHFDPGSMPTVTVIIPLHFENVRILSRTIVSILLHTPRNLLAQIILVIDNEERVDEMISQLFHLLSRTNALENWTNILRPFLHYSSHFPLLFGEKFDRIQIHWSGQRIGWSRSIENVLNKSIGDVLIFLKSHVEVSHDWLPPLLGPIIDDAHTITIPTFGRTDPILFTTSIEPRSVILWDASLRNFPRQVFRMSNNHDSLDPNWQTYPLQVDLLSSPQFAISKFFLDKIRLFDSDQVVGQNFDPILDYTLKVAQCGGRILEIPCSTVYLLAKKGPDPMGQVIDQTYIRHDWNYQPKCLLKLFAEHYFAGDHSTLQAFNIHHPNLVHFPCTVSLGLPQQCSCKISPIQITDGGNEVIHSAIHWYPLIRIQTFVKRNVPINLHYGQLANIQYSVCMSPLKENNAIIMIESYCYDKPITEALRLDQFNRLIYEEYCLKPNFERNEIRAQPCSELNTDRVEFEWKFSDGKLITSDGRCLDYQPLIGFIYNQCSCNNSGQFWQWIN